MARAGFSLGEGVGVGEGSREGEGGVEDGRGQTAESKVEHRSLKKCLHRTWHILQNHKLQLVGRPTDPGKPDKG